jgi:hypothetical protein
MLSLHPTPKHSLHALKTYPRPADLIKVDKIIRDIYYDVLHAAELNKQSYYAHKLPKTNNLYLSNMPEILQSLKLLFPDSSVSHTLLAKGKDGKLYDIEKLTDCNLSLVNTALDDSYIFIDWS